MEKMNVRVTFIEDVLGTSPANEKIYRDFIGSKAPDASTVDDEVEALGADAVVEKGKTIFPKFEDGSPFQYDYQWKGNFKDSCGALRKVPSMKSSKCKAFKKEIDKLIFVSPRKIPIENYGVIGECERPLRAQTMQGERVSLAISEEIKAGARMTFTVTCLLDSDMELVREWLDYGILGGYGQWRSSGRGRYCWQELDDDGNVIGGNYADYPEYAEYFNA